MPWAAVRHEVPDEESKIEEAGHNPHDRLQGQCTHAVLLTCLHLSHEMLLREVGQYAWMTPFLNDPLGSMMKIMKRYTAQLHELSPLIDVNVRAVPDPSMASIQAALQRTRAAAGPDSYVAMLYSGHGIQEPPTEAGELWCYDRSFDDCVRDGGGPSEYIPILLFDILTWSGASTCYVWDTPHAGRFLRAAITETEEIDAQLRAAAAKDPTVGELHPAVYSRRHIHFAACAPDQTIPRVQGMPDDLFTACLTSPLRTSLAYHVAQAFPLTTTESARWEATSPAYVDSLWESMSPSLKSRLWAELEAVLHTIAWQSMDGKDYQRLFGQSGDLICGLAGGFLLAQRVMASYRATPESIPRIPSSTRHHLWTHWDLILDNLFGQLPRYFDDAAAEGWEGELRLVSFLSDQLDSIIATDPTPATTAARYPPALARLPIICGAALTDEFRQRGCLALDRCLRGLDANGLAQAVCGGVANVAAKLLAVDDPKIRPQLISIWASLVRHPACITTLACDGRTADRLTSIPAVRFFLDYLEQHLEPSEGHDKEMDIGAIVQPAAVLAAIAEYVAGRDAPRFVERTLHLGSLMLDSEVELVQQWGAMLVAEVVGSIRIATAEHIMLLETLKVKLLDRVHSKDVETRGSAVYALARWVPSGRYHENDIAESLGIARELVGHARLDGSALVRKELVRFFHRVLALGGEKTIFILLVDMVESVVRGLPDRRAEWRDLMKEEVGERLCVAKMERGELKTIQEMVGAMKTLMEDPYCKVSVLARTAIEELTAPLKRLLAQDDWEAVCKAWDGGEWGPRELDALKRLAKGYGDGPREPIARVKVSNELFEKSKASLHACLAEQDRNEREALPGQDNGPELGHERTWTLRHRSLEDAFVLAEQQVGLPWRWHMKDISSPDVWSTVAFHSFLDLMLVCNDSNELILWQWGPNKKVGNIPLSLPHGAYVKNARFVNELHERIVILAEISNGDIHVLSGAAHCPVEFKTLSSFLALDMKRFPVTRVPDPARQKGLVTSWWRQSGNLCVGGMSSVINVWDCPAERCVRTFKTHADVPLMTLITEPVSGNILLSGFADGIVKLYDLRHHGRTGPALSWLADEGPTALVHAGDGVPSGEAIVKLGVVLGEYAHVTSACANGLINIHDLRRLSAPTASTLAHPSGTASASFQAHSGLMSTVSPLSSKTAAPSSLAQTLATLTLTNPQRPAAHFALFRSTTSTLNHVTSEPVEFDLSPAPDKAHRSVDPLQPYTVMHPLRPYLGVGLGNMCHLRGSGVGEGDDTDSGSYTFLKAQAGYV